MNGRPAMPPSPPHSVTRSSTAASMHSVGGNSVGPGRKYSTQVLEDQLQEHHRVLKDFLAQSLREDRGYQPHNRARDKLLRLSQIQFQELSTDVYDELLRRQDEQTILQDPSALQQRVPKFLLPKNNFHPKRNQARQKLSTLASKKFRELATDVLFELERRNPRFTGAENVRRGSPSGANGSRAPGMTVGIPSYDATGRRPSAASPPYSPGVFDDRDRAVSGASNGDYGRPLPKTFHADTMVPNKSTMVEDDDDQSADDDDDAFGLEGRTTARSSRRTTNMSTAMRMRDSNFVAESQAQVSRLEQRVNELEEQMRQKDDQLRSKDDQLRQTDDQLRQKDDDLNQSRIESQETHQAMENERTKHSTLTADLEKRVQSAEELNASLKKELETAEANNEVLERDVQNAVDTNEWKGRYEELEKEYDERQRMTDEVRQEAAQALQEMRTLADRSHQAIEHEENLMQQVSQLEAAMNDWKSRYSKAKTQLRTMRATSMGLYIDNPDAAQFARGPGVSDPQGLIRDVSVTNFQIAIDELLHVVRTADSAGVLDHTRTIVQCVRAVSDDIETAVIKDSQEDIKKRGKLKARVVTACNSLISTSRSFANSQGLSPVSLVDAAAGNLTFAVVDLIKTAKVRPTPGGELDGDDEDDHDALA